jgi:hypothetical protein
MARLTLSLLGGFQAGLATGPGLSLDRRYGPIAPLHSKLARNLTSIGLFEAWTSNFSALTPVS